MHPILQSESNECALASLAMVANAHGLQLDLFDLRLRFPVSLKGATLQQLISHAGSLNFSSRPLRLEIDELAQLALPCILHWDLNHFVVLKKVGRGHITVLDPAVGERRLSLAEVSRHFTGVALELTPNAAFHPADQRQRVLLARALYKRPKVLALDEATSHMDFANEHQLTQALAQLPLMRIIVAHRPETIAGAQRVVGLQQGQVHEVMRG